LLKKDSIETLPVIASISLYSSIFSVFTFYVNELEIRFLSSIYIVKLLYLL